MSVRPNRLLSALIGCGLIALSGASGTVLAQEKVLRIGMTAADMAGVSIAMSSSAPPLLSIPVARTTPVGPADSPRQRVRLLCGVPYGAGQFGDLAWGHG